MSEYIKTIFWQIEITVPKDRAAEFEEFFLRSGAQSTFELLYAEGRISNLVEDNTNLYFFFDESFPARAFVPMALATLNLIDAPFTVSQVKYADYLKEFEKTFRAFALTEKTALIPPWDPENADLNPKLKKLYLVPGMAFGTGKHATTQLMVEFIEENIRPGDTAIDMGCGSGILAIAALLWGAQQAFGIDVESLAVESANSNSALNAREHGLTLNAKFSVGDFGSLSEIHAEPKNTVFLANILPNIFEQNGPALKLALSDCRTWALSGIPVSQAETFAKFLGTITQDEFHTREKDEWLIFYASIS